jgi:hypothetical protein
LKQNPSWVAKFAQGVTDIAGRVNRLIEGEGKGSGFYFNIPETTQKFVQQQKRLSALLLGIKFLLRQLFFQF